jgi:hypothetical protein
MKLRFDINTLDVDLAAEAFVTLVKEGVADITLTQSNWDKKHFNMYGDIQFDKVELLNKTCPAPAWNDDASEL